MDLTSVYEITQNGKTCWVYCMQGGNTYLALRILRDAEIAKSVNNILTEMDAFLDILLQAPEKYVHEISEAEYGCLKKTFHNSGELGSIIKFNFDTDMMIVQRNDRCGMGDYKIKISDAKALYEVFVSTNHFKTWKGENCLYEFEDSIMSFLDQKNKHLQNCTSKKLRFRNNEGSLVTTVKHLCSITKAEADNYYIDGDAYDHAGKRYTLRKEIEFGGGRIVTNKEINRLQIFFDEIPGPDIRSELKSWGFKFSRYNNNAWQRQLNSNAFYAAKMVMKKIESIHQEQDANADLGINMDL